MIELNNLIFNATANTDPKASATELPQGDLLTADTQTTLADANNADDPLNLDASSFVLLMAQVIANSQVLPQTSAETTAPIVDATAIQTDEPVNNSTEIVAAQIETTLDKPVDLNNNIAMTWINSESYTPPQSSQIPVELADHQPAEIEQIDPALELIPKAIAKAIGLFTDPNQDDIQAATLQTQEAGDVNLKDMLKGIVSTEDNIDTNMVNAASALSTTNTKIDPTFANLLMGNSTVNTDNKTKTEPTVDNNVNLLQSTLAQTPIELQTAKANPNVQNLNIQQDVNSPQWGEKFAQHIVWMGQQGVKSALIRLHPEELGPIEISIKMVKDAATVNINSHSTHVCNIVDQSIPKLREMMADQGLNLAEVHVSADSDSQRSSQQNNFNQDVANTTEDEVLLTPLTVKPAKGLIDYFA